MRVSVIDPDMKRRARVVRLFSACGAHAEIFETSEEFLAYGVTDGYIFAYDQHQPQEIECAITQWRETVGPIPIVMYSDDPELENAIKAILAGALDYLEWPLTPEKLEKVLLDVGSRAELIKREEEMRRSARLAIDGLTAREKQVLQLITLGNSNKKIAHTLELSIRTVEVHRANIFSKINAGSTADAVRISVYAGLDRELL